MSWENQYFFSNKGIGIGEYVPPGRQKDYIGGAAEARRTGYGNALNRWDTTFEPYKGFGGRRVADWEKLLNDPSSVTSTPGYAFRLKQGQESLDNSAASRGGLLSGNALRATTQYGQDYASNEYDKALERQRQGAQFGATVDTNYANATAQLEKELGLSNAQQYGDLSNWDFYNTQLANDQAQQWAASLRGGSMAMAGFGGLGSGNNKNTTTTNAPVSYSNSGNSGNSFLSYYGTQPSSSNSSNNEYPTDNSGNIDWEKYLKRGSMYLNY